MRRRAECILRSACAGRRNTMRAVGTSEKLAAGRVSSGCYTPDRSARTADPADGGGSGSGSGSERGRAVSGTGKRPLEGDEARCGPETAMIGRGVAFCQWVSSKVYSPGRYFPSTEPLRPGGLGVAARPYAVAGGVLWWQAAAVMVAAVMVGSCSGALGAGRADGDGVSA